MRGSEAVCVLSSIIIFIVISMRALAVRGEALAPAVYLFGDSLADVGNNNYLPLSIAKADFIHNGIDFPSHKPTGRFSNGKNAADFLAEKLGLSSPPPYLYMLHGKMTNFQTGVNFASGGAGIFNGTDQLFKQNVPLTKQIEYYSAVRSHMLVQLGESDLDKIQSKAVHAIIIGSNDILGYHAPSSNFSKLMNPTQFVELMVTTIKLQLQHLHNLGGRKFMMIGVGAIGCCPQQRIKTHTGDCNEPANAMSADYNKGLRSVLNELATSLKGFSYVFLDTYSVLLDFVQNPQTYGFKEVKSACCGLGNLNADVPCIPISKFCPNRSDHLFWDLYHPSEAADRFVVDAVFDDQRRYTYPINLSQYDWIEYMSRVHEEETLVILYRNFNLSQMKMIIKVGTQLDEIINTNGPLRVE
ncbi:hypothetical protein V2J09_008447 [Rumex salicifolius]